MSNPATAVNISAAGSSDPYPPDTMPHVVVFSDGAKVALVRTTGSSSSYILRTSGGGWQTAVALPADDMGYGNYTVVKDAGDNAYVISQLSGNLKLRKLAYSAGAITVSVVTATIPSFTFYGKNLDAVWNSTYGYWYIITSAATSSAGLSVFTVTPAGVIGHGVANITSFTNAFPRVRIVSASAGAGTIYALATVGYFYGPVSLWPITPGTGGAISVGSEEDPGFGDASDFSCAFDNSGNLDIVFSSGGVRGENGGVGLYAIKRTGSSSYSSVSTLTSSNTLGSSFCIAYDAAVHTGDLWVMYVNTQSQSAGEIYVAKRLSGTWTTPTLFVGGDSSSYLSPTCGPFQVGAAPDLLYVYSSSRVYYYAGAASAAPNTPVVTIPTPNWGVGTLTPTLTASYNNVVLNDTQGACEWIITRVSDSVQMWDSGTLTQSSPNAVYAGTALSYAIQYQAKTRQKDLIAGFWSAYSTAVNFTLVQAPTVAITGVASPTGTTYDPTSPVAVTGTSLDITASYSQAASDACNGYLATIYASDGVTVVATTTGVLSPTVASGGTVTITNWVPAGMLNSTTYKLAISLTDAVTGVPGVSAQWTLNVSFTPPASVGNPYAVVKPDTGFINLSWANPGSIASVLVQRAPHGTTNWATLYNSTTLRTTLGDPAPLLTAVDYQIIVTSTNGIQSLPVTISNLVLGLPLNKYPIILNDAQNPMNYAFVGIADSGLDVTLSKQWASDVLSVVPHGNTTPKESYGPTNYWSFQRVFWIPGTDSDGVVTLFASTVIANLLAMKNRPLLYRDVTGEVSTVTLKNPLPAPINGVDFRFTADFSQVQPSGVAVIV